MKILITGACGYIGRSLIAELEGSHQLQLLDRTPPEQATMFDANSGGRIDSPITTRWPYIQAELTDESAVLKAAEGMDAVIHLAAVVHGRPETGIDTFRTNALGTFIMLEASRLSGVQRFLCASSINAYGTFYWRLNDHSVEYIEMPLDESFDAIPQDPYSLSKLVNEQTCAAFHRAYGITTAAFRFAGVWRQDMVEERRAEGLPATTEWSDYLFQWVHVADLVRGIRQAVEAPGLPGHGVYNLGAADTLCPEPTMEILQKFRPDLADNVTVPLKGRAPLLSIDRARQAFGYDPQHRMGPE